MRLALEHPNFFAGVLDGDSWRTWRILLIAAMGEPLTDVERVTFEAITGRPHESLQRAEELWGIVGRRGGKTRAIAVLACYIAAMCEWDDVLAPGERGQLPIMSASMQQAQKCFSYILGICQQSPYLKTLLERNTSDTISLSTRIDIEVRPANYRTIRGGTAVAAIGDEAAFWVGDTTVNPDTEILNAIRPAMATTGGILAVISSPYARRGEVWTTYRRHYGPDGDPLVLVAKGASRTFNPDLSEKVIARAFERDPASASAEYGAEFRQDLESFVSREAIERCTMPGRHELPAQPGIRYVGFVDASGGSVDSFTLGIGHREGEIAVLDLLREVRPPFSPDDVVAQFSAVLKSYRITSATSDRYALGWVAERFGAHGVKLDQSAAPKSELYGSMLPLLNSGRIELLDNQRMLGQLANLERRTRSGGRDSIDHPPGAHDDLINAAAGALVLAAAKPRMWKISPAMLARASEKYTRPNSYE